MLLTGSGANALAFLCHGIFMGAQVVMVGNPTRLPKALTTKALCVIDYKAPDLARQLELAFPHGIDHILEAIGFDENINLVLPLLNPNGQIGVYGCNGRTSYGIQPFQGKSSFHVYCRGYEEGETHDLVIQRVRNGALKAQYWYDSSCPVPLTDIAQAYRDLQARKALKYLIDLA